MPDTTAALRHGLFAVTLASSLAALAGCGGSATTPPIEANSYRAGLSDVAPTTADELLGGACSVSADGLVWYRLPAGAFPPIDFAHVNCTTRSTIDARLAPKVPAWAHPAAPTQAIFVATSLEEKYLLAGMQAISRDAQGAGVPVTWMVGNAEYFSDDGAYYNQLHAAAGDDVELEESDGLYAMAERDLPWFAPSVSVEGAGRERQVQRALARGNAGFWGITWNSHGTDNTSDEGAPWGTFCADPTSYKRPSPSGDCSLVSFEWTARDLTRAYIANTNSQGYSAEAAFSTDPEDVLMRGGFDEAAAVAYERAMVDAYAAAGVSQPLVMMSQQEAGDEGARAPADDPILQAVYQQAKADGMAAMTLRSALSAAKQFSGKPRAIAFPYIDGGTATSYDGAAFAPATIDYHDSAVGMTFLAGHTLPARLYRYATDPISTFNATLVPAFPGDATFPVLTSVGATSGVLSFHFVSPQATHFGIALWSDPATLRLGGSNVVAAGHAGAVVSFDLPAGTSTQSVVCGACTSTTFSYST